MEYMPPAQPSSACHFIYEMGEMNQNLFLLEIDASSALGNS